MNDIYDMPRADEPSEFDRRPSWRQVGPEGRAFDRQNFRANRTNKQAFRDGIDSNVLSLAARNLRQRVDTDDNIIRQAGQAIMALAGQAGKWGEYTWDRSEHFDEVTKDIPREYWEDIFKQTSLEGALITKRNIQDELARAERIGMSSGALSAMTTAGMLLDVDLPLTLVSGGSIASAKVAGRTAYLTRQAGGSLATSRRAAGVAAGVSGGAQAGAIVGVGLALQSDTHDWMDATALMLSTTAFGGALGTIAPSMAFNMQRAHADFIQRVRNGDPELWARQEPIVEPTHSPVAPPARPEPGAPVPEGTPTPRLVELEEGTGAIPAVYPRGESLSAGAVPQTPTFPRLEDPMGPFSDTHANIITTSRQRVDDANVQQQIDAKRENFIDRLGASKAFTIPSGTNDWYTLVRSNSAVLRVLAADVFESASGYVRGNVANAAQLVNVYQGAIARHITYLDKHMVEWANAQGNRGVALGVTPFGVKRDIQSAFYREVQMYVNEMSLGRTPPQVHPSVEQAALGVKNMGNEAAFILKGKQGQHAVSGSENLPTDGWYSPYRWNGSTIANLVARGQVTWSPPANRPNAAPVHRNAMRTSITDAIAEGYIKAGTVSDKVLARAMADALVSRFTNKGARLDDSMMSLFSGDGREYLRNSLRASNLSEAEVTNIMRRFDAQAAERGKMSSLKRRNDLDLSVPIKGTNYQLVDLLRQDYDNVLLGYSRETAGQAALARQGIRSRAEIEDYIQAAQAEQRALGEDVIDGDFLRAMFSEFNGGPQWGYAYGRTNKGVGDAVATAKAATSLSVLTFNGAAQLAETGVVMLATGLNNYFNRAVLPFLDKAMIQNNKRLLNEIEQAGFVVGRDHETMKPHLALDDATAMRFHNSDSKLIMHRMREVVGKGNYLQGYTSMLNGIRSWQQRSAVLGIGDKVMKMVRAGDDDAFREGGRAFRDLGLNPDSYAQLQAALRFVEWEDGATGQFVKAFNFDQWPEQLVEDFTVALSRGMDQSVQRSLPGETSRWMHTEVGNLATHLKTFPMLAVQKQFIRNASQADAQAAGTVAAAFMSAYTAMYLRDKLTGRERDPEELVRAAFGYSNITGWIPMVSDPLVSMLGMPELRANQFGAYSSPLEIPTVSTINNLARAGGGVWNVLHGKDNWTDRQAMRQLPFVRLAESAGRLAGFELIDAPRERPAAQRRQEQPSTPEQSMLSGQQQDRETFEQALE